MATRTWTGTTSTSFTLAANWGGTAPVAGDDVIIGSATRQPTITASTVALRSVTINTGGTLTVSGTLNITTTTLGDLILAGGTITGASAINVYGSLSLSSTSTWSATGTLTFSSAVTGKTINTNGRSLSSSPITFNASGGVYTLNSNVTTTGAITHTAGGIALNNFVLSGATFTASGTTARTLSFGTSGAIECTQATTSTVFSIASATTTQYVVSGTPTIRVTGTAGVTTTRTVSFGNATWSAASSPFSYYINCDSTSIATIVNTLAVSSTFVGYGNITVVSGNLTLQETGSTDFRPVFSGNLNLAGCGAFVLSPSVIYSQININNDFITPPSGGSISTGAGKFLVNGNSTVSVNTGIESTTNLTINAAVTLGVSTNTGKLTLSGNLVVNANTTISGNIDITSGNLTLTGNITVNGTLTCRGNIALGSSNLKCYSFIWQAGQTTAKYYSSTGGTITLAPPGSTSTTYNCYLSGLWNIATGTTAKTINFVLPQASTNIGINTITDEQILNSHNTLFDLSIRGGNAKTAVGFSTSTSYGTGCCTCVTYSAWNYWNNVTIEDYTAGDSLSQFAPINSVTGDLYLGGNYANNTTRGITNNSIVIYPVSTQTQTFYATIASSANAAPSLMPYSTSKVKLLSNFTFSTIGQQYSGRVAPSIDFNNYTMRVTALYITNPSNFTNGKNIEFIGIFGTLSTTTTNSDFTGITITNSITAYYSSSGLSIFGKNILDTLTNTTNSTVYFIDAGVTTKIKAFNLNNCKVKGGTASTPARVTLEKPTAWYIGPNSTTDQTLNLIPGYSPVAGQTNINYLEFTNIIGTVTGVANNYSNFLSVF